MFLRTICGIRRMDRVINSLIRENFGCELRILEKLERNLLKWFGHMEKIGGGGEKDKIRD